MAQREMDQALIRAIARGDTSPRTVEGLRERKKHQMRALLSDTATAMFLERGFDEVRIAEIAQACDVSEKTVHNYFPAKEALLLDEDVEMAAAVRAAASSPDSSPLQAMLDMFGRKVHDFMDAFDAQGGATAMGGIARFNDLIENTPSLRAYHRDSVDRLVTVAAESLAERAGRDAGDPQVQVAAFALIALWRVLAQSLLRHTDCVRAPAKVAELVLADLASAARVVDSGLANSGIWTGSSA